MTSPPTILIYVYIYFQWKGTTHDNVSLTKNSENDIHENNTEYGLRLFLQKNQRQQKKLMQC